MYRKKYLFMNKNMQVEGKQCANMGFVNKMEKGKTYLVFLDKRAKKYKYLCYTG